MSKPKPRRPANIIEAVTSDEWWGPWFKDPESWLAWQSFWKAIFAFPMDERELAIFRECTGRRQPPAEPQREVCEVIGRRGGKSRAAATTAAWLSLFVDWRPYLAPGEKACVLLLAADRRQARVALRYVRSLILDHPELRKLVVRETQEGLELANRVIIEVSTASFRTIRGYSIAALIADELAFWIDNENSANPAEEVLAAVRPAMSTMGPNALLVMMSSPHARRGPLWQAFSRHYGKEDAPVLVWRAPTKVMNPSVPQRSIDEAYEEDPLRAAAEYGAEFRTDVETYVPREVVEDVVVAGRRELAPMRGLRYHAFCDPSGGSSDSMTLAIGHNEAGRIIIDAIRERKPPFSPSDACLEFSAALRSYNVGSIQSDRFGGAWVTEAFSRHGVRVEQAAKPKSDLYVDLLPLLNAKRIELLDHPRLISQLVGLERRTARFSGKDSIDHGPNGHDDIANSIAGVASLVLGQQGFFVTAEIASELLARIAATPPHRPNPNLVWPLNQTRQARVFIPLERRIMPRSVLPAEKFDITRSASNDATST
jgi:hypothetical protein